jgi:hypothetical protein
MFWASGRKELRRISFAGKRDHPVQDAALTLSRAVPAAARSTFAFLLGMLIAPSSIFRPSRAWKKGGSRRPKTFPDSD